MTDVVTDALVASEDSETNKARILMVDDSKVMRKSVLKMLGADFDILVAEDGAQGWEIIQQDNSIQVVFTDLNMPRVNGYELLKLVRTSPDDGIRNLPMIVVTGAENDDQAKELALEQGATDFITKPFNSTDLKARAMAHANHNRATKTLQKISTRDVLTGLLNRRAFVERLSQDASFVVRHQEDLTLLVVEVDSFNELFLKIGRQGADSVLKQVGKVLEKTVRQEDAVGRIGLARFAMSLPTASADGARKLAERVVRTVESFKARLRGEAILISVSVGGRAVPVGVRADSDVLLKQAESELVPQRARSQIQVDRYAQGLEDGPSFAGNISSPDRVGVRTDALVSIDLLLDQVREGRVDAARAMLTPALQRLAPLWVLLTKEERSRLVADIEGPA
ncbi:Putative response regulator [gamma proteobacterium HdN1]|nr:Putative response regulator [gamma proteobacterium HdN1]